MSVQSPSTVSRNDSNNMSISILSPPLPSSATATATATATTQEFTTLDNQQEWFPEDFHPPENFGMVSPNIYRSGMPKKRNFPFLQKLQLKSILTLILEDYPTQNQIFLEANGIRLYQFGVAGNKEPFADISEKVMSEALRALMDPQNHPILVHCNKGKHRTGCLVGCLRKLQEWTNTSIFEEYRRYATPKARSMDQQFIELFEYQEQ